MSQTHHYQVKVNFLSDRKGELTSDVLTNQLEIATPPEFPKGMEGIWSPEHYFVAAVNGCLMTTFLAIAENFKLAFKSFSSEATGTLEVVDGKYMISKVEMHPFIAVDSEDMVALAEKVIAKSEKACLISNSVKSEITMIPKIQVVN